ncbi:MAG: DUF5329 domain-containing protein [Gammaproteobacteria bacterium]|nr:DUF5329 domain-containing protein [Gammaproteobacteria bacterium]
MQRLRNNLITSLILMLLVLPVSAISANTEQEIQHLFNFIVASDCIFIRNNTEYTASEARAHMQRKYDYARHWIGDTEQFISRIASKSSMSGSRYQIRCQNQLLYSDNWLKQELQRYRTSQQ